MVILGFLGIVVGLGLLALEFIITHLSENGNAFMGYGIPVMIIFCGFVSIFLSCITRSASEQIKREENRQKGFFQAINYLKKGKFKDLIFWYKTSADLNEDPTQIIVRISEFMQEDSPECVQELTEKYSEICSSIESSLCEAYLNYADKLVAENTYSSAKKWYQLAYKQDKNIDTCICLGLCCLCLKDYSNTVKFLQESLTYQKTFIALYNLLLAHTHLNRYKDALEDLKELRKMFPEQLSSKKKLLIEIPLEHLTEVQ